MSELKTLAELWREAGEKPFDAVLLDAGDECRIHIVGISPDGIAVGWAPYKKHTWNANDREWRVAPPAPKKVTGYVYLWDGGEAFDFRKTPALSNALLACKRFEVTVTEGEFDE